jgi:hypothetical protein
MTLRNRHLQCSQWTRGSSLLEIIRLRGMKYLLSMADLEGVEGVAVMLSMAVVGEADEDALKPGGQELAPAMQRREPPGGARPGGRSAWSRSPWAARPGSAWRALAWGRLAWRRGALGGGRPGAGRQRAASTARGAAGSEQRSIRFFSPFRRPSKRRKEKKKDKGRVEGE